jgi:Zn-dependent peptidase ImmA (M78 family)
LGRKLVMANPRSGAEIDTLASTVIRKIQPEALRELNALEVERLFECELEGLTRIETDYRKLPQGIHGYTDSETMECVISQELIDDPSQLFFCRSTMGHEVGHALIHVPEFRQKKALLRSIHDPDHASLRLYREADIPTYRNPEWQAWRFAGALFMPEPMIRLAIEKGYSIEEMSEVFEVNPAFVKTRLRALRLA